MADAARRSDPQKMRILTRCKDRVYGLHQLDINVEIAKTPLVRFNG